MACSRPIVTRWALLLVIAAALAGLAITVRGKPASYSGAFTDWDGYVLAIGADVRTYRRITGIPDLPVLGVMSEAAFRLHRKAVVPSGDGWVFEPGAYSDHRDFAFAGRSTMEGTVSESRIPGISWDSSHFSRWPLWLNSFELADRPAYYRSLRTGLARQFERQVLVPPDRHFRTYRLNNYMDGRNGLFRWNGVANESYGPFQLSGTFVYGWWSELKSPAIREAYRHISLALPFSPTEYAAFFGPFNWMSNEQVAHLTRLAALSETERPDSRDIAYWKSYESEILAQSICDGSGSRRGRTAQDAQYELMIPMHIAFRYNIPGWKADLAAHFARFPDCDTAQLPRLDELHYLYFVSRFMVLSAQSGQSALVPDAVRTAVERRLFRLWVGEGEAISNQGWGEPRFTAFSEYLEWKIGLKQ